MPNDIGCAVDVDGSQLIEIGGGNLPQRGRGVNNGGIVDQEVGGSSSSESGFAKRGDIIVTCYIARDEVSFGMSALEMGQSDFVSSAADETVTSFEELRD